LVPIRHQPELLREFLLTAIKPGRHKDHAIVGKFWRDARTIVSSQVRPVPNFTGRDSEIAAIDRALSSGQSAAITQAATVHGLGGIGKSALAREYTWRARERDSYAGIWWLDAETDRDSLSWSRLEQGLVALGNVFNPGLDQIGNLTKAAEWTLDFIANGGFPKRWLLVYDNVDDARALEKWGPLANVDVIVTSRLSNWSRAVMPIEVGKWPLPEAEAYLGDASGRQDLTKADLTRIAKTLGCLPLALAHAAAYLRDVKNAMAESYLAAIAHHMNEAPAGAGYDRAVFATFREAAEHADARAPGAKAVLERAAFFAPDNIPEEFFRPSAEPDPSDPADVVAAPPKLEKAIGALDRLSLIEFDQTRRTVSLHRLVQAATRDALRDRADGVARAACLTAFSALPEPDYAHWATYERLVPHIRAVAAYVSDDMGQPLAWLLGSVGTYLMERVALNEVLPVFERVRRIHDRLAKADPGNAGWQRDLSVSHNKIGDVLVEQGTLPAALESYKAALAIRDRLAKADPGNAGWQRDLALSYGRLGMVQALQGARDAARGNFRQGKTIIARLVQQSADNATLPKDLVWFDGQIAALER
jgi:tetratricopeptide (TPR) repeat protein